MSGKGSSPRPFSVSQEQFDANWDAIFGEKKVAEYQCHCFNCNKDRMDESGRLPYTMTRMIVCPTCGNKRCPHSTDHRYECTHSNDPGQPGSRYQ